MNEVYILDDAIISPLGFTTASNLTNLRNNISGLELHLNKGFETGNYYAGIIEPDILLEAFLKIGDPGKFTKLEQMMILAVHGVICQNPGINLDETGLIISSTKGNIDLLETSSTFPGERVYLAEMANTISRFFHFKNKPVVVSNACISGGHALMIGKRFINSGKFKKAIVIGGDIVSQFVVSGFQSFMALSNEPCKPYSKSRKGINIGEAAAAVLLSDSKGGEGDKISLVGEASVNDANHISGPSRAGEGLFQSVNKAMTVAGISFNDIDHISAHGTGTIYNDEMEAIAFNRCGLQNVPLNSYKGYYGHTLGASALLESVITKHSLLNNELYTSLNFDDSGLSMPLNIITKTRKKSLNLAIKTASGFGGSNIALVFRKI